MPKPPGLEYDNAVMGSFHLMRRMYVFALGMSMTFLTLVSAVAIAQSRISDQPNAIDKPLAYDVVSIKPSHPDAYESWSRMTADTLSMDVTLKSLIMTAYFLQTDNLISGLPGWAATAQFDVEAKMDADTAASLAKFPQREQNTQRQAMLQALLADRFGLKIHHETRKLLVYKLVVAKGGFKMQETPALEGAGTSAGRGQFKGRGIPIGNLVTFLSGTIGKPVVDRSGLNGRYDAELHWTPDDGAGPSENSGDFGPSLNTALQEQLGLKLEPSKEPMDTIVVDHLVRPSEN